MGYEYYGQPSNTGSAATFTSGFMQQIPAATESPLSSSLGSLVNMIASLEQAAERLGVRLAPVMSIGAAADPSGHATGIAPQASAPTLEAIQASSRRVEAIVNMLNQIHSRLVV